MPTDVFRGLCEQLGYDPDRVLSVRVNRDHAVVVHTDESGSLQMVTYAQAQGSLHLRSRGAPFGRGARLMGTRGESGTEQNSVRFEAG